MLDMLSGTDSSSGGEVPITPVAMAVGDPVAEETDTLVDIENKSAEAKKALDGVMLAKFLMASREWQEASHAMKKVLTFLFTR